MKASDRNPVGLMEEPRAYAESTRSYRETPGAGPYRPKSRGFEGMKDVLRILLSALLPPLGVFWQVGLGKHFWINVVLTLFGYLPGFVHALWVIVTK